MAIEVGQEAPDFTLPNGNGDKVSLSDFRGQNVVLAFFPLAFSGVCTAQFTAIGQAEGQYSESNAQVIGVSVDSHYALAAWSEQVGLSNTVLLADFEPKGDVARTYGTYLDMGFSNRATFIIDKDGVVRDIQIMGIPTDSPDVDQYFQTLATCPV